MESGNENHYKETVVNQVLELAKDYPVILGFNIDDKNVMDFGRKQFYQRHFFKRRREIRPGYKDFDELADILETLEIDDHSPLTANGEIRSVPEGPESNNPTQVDACHWGDLLHGKRKVYLAFD